MTLKELENHSDWVLSQITDLHSVYRLNLWEEMPEEKTIISKQGGLVETKEGDFYPAYALQNIKLIGE